MKFAVKNLTHNYSKKVQAIRNFSTELHSQKVTALLGPNGAGKSTLFKILAGLIRQTSGTIEINGTSWDRNDPEPLGKIGFVFQDPTIDGMRSGTANLTYAGQLQGLSNNTLKPRIDELIAKFDMGDYVKRPVGSLSGGQRRRLEIARALIHRPIWLFLDEPSTGLDIDNRLKLSETLHSLVTAEGCGVLWCTHIPDELRSGDSIIMMKEGEKIFDGQFDSLEQVMSQYQSLVGKA